MSQRDIQTTIPQFLPCRPIPSVPPSGNKLNIPHSTPFSGKIKQKLSQSIPQPLTQSRIQQFYTRFSLITSPSPAPALLLAPPTPAKSSITKPIFPDSPITLGNSPLATSIRTLFPNLPDHPSRPTTQRQTKITTFFTTSRQPQHCATIKPAPSLWPNNAPTSLWNRNRNVRSHLLKYARPILPIIPFAPLPLLVYHLQFVMTPGATPCQTLIHNKRFESFYKS